MITNPGLLNLLSDLDEKLLVFSRILASYKHFDWESAALELLEMFGWKFGQ